MTFAALFVSEKREKKKSYFKHLAGEQCSPLQDKTQVQPTAKTKDLCPSAFSFAYAGAKEKAIKKKTPK